MQFTPMTDEEIKASSDKKEFPIYPAGEYPFEIITANEGPSKSSEYSRIAINMKIYQLDGSYTWVNDYLSASPKAAFKIRNAAEACGLLENYNAGELAAEDFIRKQGFVKIGVEPATDEYFAKNKVVAYVVKKEKVKFDAPPVKAAAKKQIEQFAPIESDDIPW